jgi:hypothetical protein
MDHLPALSPLAAILTTLPYVMMNDARARVPLYCSGRPRRAYAPLPARRGANWRVLCPNPAEPVMSAAFKHLIPLTKTPT